MQNPVDQSDDLFKVIPGYREAIKGERSKRDRDFTPGLTDRILGIEVLPMTFGHLLKLSAVESPFVGCGIPSPDSVMQFLWCVSPEYGAAISLRRALAPWAPRLAAWLWQNAQKRFGRKLRLGRAFKDWVTAIRVYVDYAFEDAPKKGGGGQLHISYFSGVSLTVKMMFDDHGCSEKDLMDMPLRKFFQHQRRIEKQCDPNAILWNRSDDFRDAWLCQQNQKPNDQRRN